MLHYVSNQEVAAKKTHQVMKHSRKIPSFGCRQIWVLIQVLLRPWAKFLSLSEALCGEG